MANLPLRAETLRFFGAASRSCAAIAVALALSACGDSASDAAALRERVRALEQSLDAERAARACESELAAAEIDALRGELTAERTTQARDLESRVAREREWLSYTQAVAALDLQSIPEGLAFKAHVPGGPDATTPDSSDPGETAAPAEEDHAARRPDEILRALRSLLAIEEVQGLDLLEAGSPIDTSTAGGATGPVVFRLLDGNGRLAGSLYAQRLRLEGSRAGRSLTLVLEDGYESHAGVRTSFDSGGVRRIQLPHVDPAPWLEALPELFSAQGLEEALDDGRWNVGVVRHTLNQLLREDVAAGWYRFKEIAGVRDGVLRGVHVEQCEADGRLERRLFADRLTILREEQGLQLLLEEGVQMRGDVKTPFLDGRFRIYLPRADAAAWQTAGVPGLSEAPARTAAR